MTILIVSYGNYPNGDAGAVRQHTFAKLFKSLGHDVFVIGMGEKDFMKAKTFDGINHISFRNHSGGLLVKLTNFFGYKSKLKKFLRDTDTRFDAILVIEIPIGALLFMKKYARRYGLKLMHDSVEWYSPEQFRFGLFSPQYIFRNLYNKRLIDKRFRVIAISSFLERHFLGRGCKTVRIPAILDVKSISDKKSVNDEKTTLVYAGSPYKKDYLNEMVKGVALLPQEIIKKIEFRIIGVNKEQLIEACGTDPNDIEKLGKSLKILGRVTREEVSKNLKEADFTVFIRSETLRYARAGFPTKAAESLAAATPVICNITSDLGDYIIDGANGLIVKGNDAKAFSEAIRRAADMSSEEKEKMRERARKSAEENFDFRCYQSEIKKLLEDK